MKIKILNYDGYDFEYNCTLDVVPRVGETVYLPRRDNAIIEYCAKSGIDVDQYMKWVSADVVAVGYDIQEDMAYLYTSDLYE